MAADRVSPVVLIDGAAVRVITLNRPEHRNAVDAELHRGVLSAVQAAAADPEVRVVVMTGSGAAFSAGGDFELIRRMQDDPIARRETFDVARSLFQTFVDLDVPVVAAVNGPCVGAGCSLALMADIVIMADDAYFADPRVPIGLVPGDGGAVLWPLLAGLPAAAAYLLTGDRFPAAEAYRLGVVHRVVPAGRVMQEALALGERLAALPGAAVRATKRALNLHVAAAAAPVFDFALAAEERSLDTPEHRAQTEALASRATRPPAQGR